MQIKINLNDTIKVRLTERGKRILEQNFKEIKIDEDGYYRKPLWYIMQEFGEYMGVGLSSPIEMEIIIDVD